MPDKVQLERVQEWARRLDEELFDLLPEMMRPDCRYESPSGVITGPEAIAGSYQRNAEWAHRTFEHVEWSSAIESEGEGRFLITFEDRTLHQGQRHRYRCQQRVELNAVALIVAIEHLPIAGQDEALEVFFTRIGVSR